MDDKQIIKLRRKLRSYRSARIGAIFLSVVTAAALILLLVTGLTENEAMTPVYTGAFVWPAIAYICHLKIRLIRRDLETLENEE